MAGTHYLTIAEQVAERIRGELIRGRWSVTLPGLPRLAAELGVNRKTVDAAVRRLEREGLLIPQGAGRKRRIELPKEKGRRRPLRVAILDFDPLPMTERYIIELQHLLSEAGHTAFFAEKCLVELKMSLPRVIRLVEKTEADAWVVVCGSREILEWFSTQAAPSFALFGGQHGLPMAGIGPDHQPALIAATRRLIALGHRRIVLLKRQSADATSVGRAPRVMLDELAAHGIPTGAFNLPDWGDTEEEFHKLLDELFRVTPPTALIIDEAFVFHAAQDHLAHRGLLAPEHVSLICLASSPTFAWCRPSIAHVRMDSQPWIKRILSWVATVGHGKEDIQQSRTKAEFLEGGTVGPARGTQGAGRTGK